MTEWLTWSLRSPGPVTRASEISVSMLLLVVEKKTCASRFSWMGKKTLIGSHVWDRVASPRSLLIFQWV